MNTVILSFLSHFSNTSMKPFDTRIVGRNPVSNINCSNTCNYANDGECDDGGPGAEYSECQLGTDCADCTELITFPPSPPMQYSPELAVLTQGENGDYMSNYKLKVVLNDLQKKYPNLIQITTIGKSVLNEDILVVKISENVTLHENK